MNENASGLLQQVPRATRWWHGAALALSCTCAVLLGYACANPSAPPGGPPDNTAPRVLKVTPTNGTVGARPKAVVFQFDEVISESPKGTPDLAKLVFISPKSGEIDVDWRRNQLDIKPKKGWKPNTVYTVLLGSGITDLRNNSIDTSTRVVFSTGGAIPETKIEGVVFDWTSGRGRVSVVEAIVRDTAKKDSIIYQTLSDSVGRYSLQHIPPGNYIVRGFLDQNSNRALERNEFWDTVGVSFTRTSNVDLHAFRHDSVGLRITVGTIVLLDSNKTLKVKFDKPIFPAQAFSNTNFSLRRDERNDSTTIINVTTVFSGPQRRVFDSLKTKATQDSMARLRPVDTSAAARAAREEQAKKARSDSIFRADQQRREELRQLALRGGRPLPPKDTTPPPKMKRPPLYDEVFVILEKPLVPGGRYVLSFQNITSVSGVVSSQTRAPFTVPEEPKAPEPRKNPGDTTNSTSVPIKR